MAIFTTNLGGKVIIHKPQSFVLIGAANLLAPPNFLYTTHQTFFGIGCCKTIKDSEYKRGLEMETRAQTYLCLIT